MKIAIALAALGCAASLAGCGGTAGREARALKLAMGTARLRGVDVWADVVDPFIGKRITYQENVPINLIRKGLAIELQDTPAPFGVGKPGPGETSPLTFEGAARNLVEAVDGSRKLLENDLSYDVVEKLAIQCAKVVLHAREAVKALERKESALKIVTKRGGNDEVTSVWEGANVASEEDEARALVKRWMPRAKLIEQNATNLWEFAATHRKPGIEDWSVALLRSCRELEEAYAGRRARRRRRRGAGAVIETGEGLKEEPGEGQDEEPEGGSEEGPAKAATPGDEEQPETGSGSSPPGRDGNPKPDAGPPQVGAFLLGVAGRRRSSRSRRRAG